MWSWSVWLEAGSFTDRPPSHRPGQRGFLQPLAHLVDRDAEIIEPNLVGPKDISSFLHPRRWAVAHLERPTGPKPQSVPKICPRCFAINSSMAFRSSPWDAVVENHHPTRFRSAFTFWLRLCRAVIFGGKSTGYHNGKLQTVMEDLNPVP